MTPVLRTERLVLRPFTEDDAERLLELDSDPEVLRHTGRWEPYTLERYRQLVHEFHESPTWWAAEEDGEFVGWFYLQEGELGYRLKRSAWGRGLATEGAHAVLAQSPGPFTADAFADNHASLRVLEKLGFRRTGETTEDGRALILFER